MRALLSFAVLGFLVSPAAAQTAAEVNAAIDNVLGDHKAYEAAFAAVQSAVTEEDAEALAGWVAYPIDIRSGSAPFTIEDAVEFVAQYDEIVTEEIATAVIEQRYEELFVNGEGVMFGNGQVWMNGICSDDACSDFAVRIIAIQSTAAE